MRTSRKQLEKIGVGDLLELGENPAGFGLQKGDRCLVSKVTEDGHSIQVIWFNDRCVLAPDTNLYRLWPDWKIIRKGTGK
jgi:hypothetical protein